MAVGEQRLDAQDDLAGARWGKLGRDAFRAPGARPRPWRGAAARAALARKRSAVASKFVRLCADLRLATHEATSCSSLVADVAVRLAIAIGAGSFWVYRRTLQPRVGAVEAQSLPIIAVIGNISTCLGRPRFALRVVTASETYKESAGPRFGHVGLGDGQLPTCKRAPVTAGKAGNQWVRLAGG